MGRSASVMVVAIVLAVAALAASASSARAHGRLPESAQIVFHPTDPDTVIVRTTFGLLLTRDGGDTWRWMCPVALQLRATEDATVAIMDSGAFVIATFGGFERSVGGCVWSYPDPALQDSIVIDLAKHPVDPASLLVVTSNGGVPNQVLRSTDDGLTFTPLGTPIDRILFETISVAPSDPMRVYLSGIATDMTPREAYVLRSTDGGESFESLPFTLETTDRSIFLLDIDPVVPDRVLLQVWSTDADDRIVLSENGGSTWTEVLRMPDVVGFARSPDGSTIWAGGLTAGLWRSMDGGRTFAQINPTIRVGGLAAREGELWVWGLQAANGFAVGKSTDGGMTFEAVMTYGDIGGILECDATSQVGMTCPAWWPDLQRDLGLYDGGVPTDGAMPDIDGPTGSEPAPPPAPDGCSCRAGALPGRSASGAAAIAIAALALMALLAASRRR